MADEDDGGMLLNFAIPQTNKDVQLSKKSKKTPIKVKGGRWSDRRKTQLELMGRSNKKQKNESGLSGANETPVAPRTQKRNADGSLNEDASKKPRNDPTSIVSSLFTSNPEIQKRDYEKQIDESKLVPSNAPMLDDPNTDFKTLGQIGRAHV